MEKKRFCLSGCHPRLSFGECFCVASGLLEKKTKCCAGIPRDVDATPGSPNLNSFFGWK